MAYARGKFRSKGWRGILDEARQLVESGVKELNLIAEDTNQYGMCTAPDGALLDVFPAELPFHKLQQLFPDLQVMLRIVGSYLSSCYRHGQERW